MRPRTLWLAAGLLLCAAAAGPWSAAGAAESEETAEAQESAQTPQQEIAQLKKRVGQLEQAAKAPGRVTPAGKGVDIKIDGRLFAGVFSTGKGLGFRQPSLDIPDAKIRFTFIPSKDVVIVNRFSNSRAATSGFDYFYLDLNNWAGLLPGHTLRIGKHKIDIGQETWTDNPMENILISNAVSHISGYDEGFNLRGPISGGPMPLTYSVEFLNNTKGFSPAEGVAWAGKIGLAAAPQLYFSGSFFRGSRLSGKDSAGKLVDAIDFNVGEVTTPPSSAGSAWRRTLWEADARYGYGREGIKSTVGSAPGLPLQFAAAYGQFTDDAEGAADRAGSYWYAEALGNLTPALYAAARYSQTELDDGILAKIGNSPVAVNSYNRVSLGLGYRLSLLTHLKAEYTINSVDGVTPEPQLNQIAVGIATKF